MTGVRSNGSLGIQPEGNERSPRANLAKTCQWARFEQLWQIGTYAFEWEHGMGRAGHVVTDLVRFYTEVSVFILHYLQLSYQVTGLRGDRRQ